MRLLRTSAAFVAVTAVTTGVVPLPASAPRVASQVMSLGTMAAKGEARKVRLSQAAEMVAFSWKGSAEDVEIRARQGGRWGDWVEVIGNPDEGPDADSAEGRRTDGGETVAGPVWVGRGVRDVQIRTHHGAPRDLKLTAIASPRSVRPRGIAGAQALPATPRIYSRAEWSADESYRTRASGCTGSVATASGGVKNAIVHHTVSANGYAPDDAPAMIRGIYHFHTHSRGWCDIGYNFLIDRFGRVFEGRFGGIDKAVIGAHAGGFNTGSTGVALLGDHTGTGVSGSSRSALVDFLAWKLGYHGVDPRSSVTVTSGGSTKYSAGTVVTLPAVSGHRDVSSTSCPGQHAYDLIPSLRPAIQSAQLASRPYPLPGWRRSTSAPKLAAFTAFGGLHPAGGQAAISTGPYWSNFTIARGVVADRTSSGGIILDGYGGLHGFGGTVAPQTNSYWRGWDITRGLAIGPAAKSGWVLDGFGGLHQFGSAPPAVNAPYFGFDIARGVAATNDLVGGYILDGYGAIHAFGVAPHLRSGTYWRGWDIARAIALRPDGRSGYVLDGFGGLHSFGGAPRVSVSHYAPGRDIFRGLVLDATGDRGWVSDVDGRIFAFGGAPDVKTSLTYTGAGVGRGLVLLTPPAG